MKRHLLIAFFALFTIFSASAADFESGGLYYNINYGTTTVSVTSDWSNPYSGDIVIPATVTNGGITYDVTAIAEEAFFYCSELNSVTIGNNVTTIEGSAFFYCTALTSVTLGSAVSIIGDQAFQSCSSLSSINIPNSVTSIGPSAFNGCSSMIEATIGNGVTSIGAYAFQACSSLTTLTIGSSVETIGTDAFSDCYLLASVVIPNSVITIESLAFDGCNSLESLTIGNQVETIGEWAFKGCSALTSVIIPNSVTSLGDAAFYGCSGLTSVTIGNSVTSIGEKTFEGCSSLTSITIPSSVTSVGDDAFSGCMNLPIIDNIRYADTYLIRAVDKTLSTYTIKSGTRFIGSYSFEDCTNLTSIDIPESVETIGSNPFVRCSSLNEFTGNFASEDGNYLVVNSQLISVAPAGLTSIKIPASISSLGSYAFTGCSSLESIKVYIANPNDISMGIDVFTDVPTATCVLKVPVGSDDLYAAAAQWSAFTKIETFSAPINITEGVNFTNVVDSEHVNVEYTRTFTGAGFYAIYLPYQMKYEDWATYGYMYEVNNVHQYDTDGDGTFDRTTIEFAKINSGSIRQHMPYVFRPFEQYVNEPITFQTLDCTVYAAPATPGSVDCSSTKMLYTMTGTYIREEGPFDDNVYALSKEGKFTKPQPGNVLNPYRFKLVVTPRENGYNPSPMETPSTISMSIDGEIIGGDDTTDIINIATDRPQDDNYYDLLGRRVLNPGPGFYIHQGKKIYITK